MSEMNVNELKRFNELEELLEHYFGKRVIVLRSTVLGGGCIGEVHKVVLDNHKTIVVKHNHAPFAEKMCIAEVEGLVTLASTETIRVPTVLGMLHDNSVVLSYVYANESPENHSTFWDNFATQLAKLHTYPQSAYSTVVHNSAKDTADVYYGYPIDNFIGTNRQINIPTRDWISFFREHRLWHQFTKAHENKFLNAEDMKQAETFCANLSNFITEPPHPSLLHGDLWSGNYICGNNNTPVLIDPAIYFGHYEADIAFTEMFGGFPERFYNAYTTLLPLDKDFHTDRKHVYNLYHQLNHLNIFGVSYLPQVLHMLSRYIQ